jgi:hypothetical protein
VLFVLGFVLATVRLVIVAPRIGSRAATLAEGPVRLGMALFARPRTEQRAALTARAGSLGLAALLIATLFRVYIDRRGRPCPG